MNPHTTRATMTKQNQNSRGNTNTTATLTATLALGLGILVAGCGPTFDPASLINSTRVVAARSEIEGAPDRASPAPGETVNVTWLVTSPQATPPLGWVFAVCAPATAGASGNAGPGCQDAPLATFEGTANPPRVSIAVPAADALGTARDLVLYGEICAGVGSTPTFDATTGIPTCTGGGGTTASITIPLQLTGETNHNPTADRAFTLDGQAWPPSAPGGDPCLGGPRVSAGTDDHVIGNTTDGADRESYTAMVGDPPAPTPARESLQISQFTTAGKLKSQFAFLEAADAAAATIVDVKWNAPAAADVPAAGLAVTFTFVVRDNRGGTDWTTRAACVGP